MQCELYTEAPAAREFQSPCRVLRPQKNYFRTIHGATPARACHHAAPRHSGRRAESETSRGGHHVAKNRRRHRDVGFAFQGPYGGGNLFPTNTYNSTSYAVDVVFKPQLVA